ARLLVEAVRRAALPSQPGPRTPTAAGPWSRAGCTATSAGFAAARAQVSSTPGGQSRRTLDIPAHDRGGLDRSVGQLRDRARRARKLPPARDAQCIGVAARSGSVR